MYQDDGKKTIINSEKRRIAEEHDTSVRNNPLATQAPERGCGTTSLLQEDM
jgi:hypothetical protein